MNIRRNVADGSRATEKRLSPPNSATGMPNVRLRLEWAWLEEMDTAAKMLVELAKAWGK